MRIEITNSSNIKSLEFNEKSGELDVEFTRGGKYRYDGVTPADVEALLGAKSIGSYFQKVFKQRFKGTRL